VSKTWVIIGKDMIAIAIEDLKAIPAETQLELALARKPARPARWVG
jgi:hypothetical protein